MSAKEYMLDKGFLAFVQRVMVIVMLGTFLIHHPENTTAWCAMGGVVTDLFHSAKNGNGNGYVK